MIHLILSLDYELFGNGAGCVMRDVVEPTARILNICERFGAPLTIMFEVAEYWAMVDARDSGEFVMSYDPAEAMRAQAVDAIHRGHDVQLHLHPQWIGAQYREGLWRLRFDRWRVATLPEEATDERDATSCFGALRRGKLTLDRMLRTANRDYECCAFRAGGFYAQPSTVLISAMKRVGLLADSSVVPGFQCEIPWHLDYGNAKACYGSWWTAENDVGSEGQSGEHVLELPICSQSHPYFHNFKWPKVRAAMLRRTLERRDPQSRIAGRKTSVPCVRGVAGKLFGKHISTVDFCKLGGNALYQAVDRIAERVVATKHAGPVPVVLIGHSKDFVNDKNFADFLGRIVSGERTGGLCRFTTMQETVRELSTPARLVQRRTPRPLGVAREQDGSAVQNRP